MKTCLAGNILRLTATNKAKTIIDFPKLIISVVIDAIAKA